MLAVLLFSVFVFIMFRQKIEKFLKMNHRNLLLEGNEKEKVPSISAVAVTDSNVIDECLNATNDCDVTYKKIAVLQSDVFFGDKTDYFFASNDEKNSREYQVTSMQDTYPTDLA